ncbi:hypothetical protein BGX23_006255 [Mortierella sp. AD031]|nr:hypothetical protein BGX23_006255 [Mortierella sp. AD031]
MSAEAAFATDISFGGDEFLLDTDELALADLMDDFDHDKESGNGNRNERGKEKDSEDDDDEDIPLSWTPTPPKVVKTTAPTPLSPLSPLSRFSSTARITGATRSFKSASISINHRSGSSNYIQLYLHEITSQESTRVQESSTNVNGQLTGKRHDEAC